MSRFISSAFSLQSYQVASESLTRNKPVAPVGSSRASETFQRQLPVPWGRATHLPAQSSMPSCLGVTRLDSQSMPAGPSQGLLSCRWDLSPNVASARSLEECEPC